MQQIKRHHIHEGEKTAFLRDKSVTSCSINEDSKTLGLVSEWNPELSLCKVGVWGSSLQAEVNWKGSFRLADIEEA